MCKKILILANSSIGLWNFRKDLLLKLKEDYEIVIATKEDDGVEELKSLGCKIIGCNFERRGKNPVKDLLILFKYNKIINLVKPDLVMTYTIKPNIYGGIVCGLKKIPFIVNITGLGTSFQKENLLKKIVTLLYKISFKNISLVFFENEGNQKLFIEQNIVNREKTCLLNGAGVNLKKFQLKEYPNNKAMKFIFIGRVMEEKGIKELFYSVKKIYNESQNIELNIIGSFEENYSQQILEGEKEGWLKYHGYQDDVRPFIEMCDCEILPSWHEGMANVNLESSAMGRPIITSNIFGCKEAVIPNESGLLFEVKNKEDLYSVIKKMLETSREDRKKMGILGRKYMEEKFDKKKVVDKTYENIKNIG